MNFSNSKVKNIFKAIQQIKKKGVKLLCMSTILLNMNFLQFKQEKDRDYLPLFLKQLRFNFWIKRSTLYSETIQTLFLSKMF